MSTRPRVGPGRGNLTSRAGAAGLALLLGTVLTGCAASPSGEGTAPGSTASSVRTDQDVVAGPDTVEPAPLHVDPSAIRSLLVPEDAVLSGIPAITENVQTTFDDTPRVPPANTQNPPQCDVAALLVGLGTSGFVRQDTNSAAGRLQQTVHLFADAAQAESAYDAVQDRASTCPTVTTDYVDAGDPHSVEVSSTADTSGTLPSFAQDVAHSADSFWTTEGYTGYVLVGNAVVHWSATAPSYHVEQMPRVDRAVLGTRGAVEAVVLAHLQQLATT